MEEGGELSTILGSDLFLVRGKLYSSHPSLLSRSCHSGERVSFRVIFVEFLLSILSFFKFKLVLRKLDCRGDCVIAYLGFYQKTKFESEFLLKYLRENNSCVRTVFLTDDENSETTCIRKCEINILNLVFYLLYGLKLLLKVFSARSKFDMLCLCEAIRQLKYYFYLEEFGFSEKTRVINFFSGSPFGHILNYVVKGKGGLVYTYSWGSNSPSKEQVYSLQDIVLLKGEYERGIYSVFDKEIIVGNVSISILNHEVNKSQFLFLDTCENEAFSDLNKEEFYNIIFKKLSMLNKRIPVVIRPHPGSSNLDAIVKKLVAKGFDVSISKEVLLNDDLEKSLLVININSSVSSMVVANKIPLVNLFPIFYERYLSSCFAMDKYIQFFELPGLSIKKGDDLLALEFVSFSYKDIKEKIVTKKYDDYAAKYFPKVGSASLVKIVSIVLD